MHRARVGVLCVHSASIALSKSKIVGGSRALRLRSAPRSFWCGPPSRPWDSLSLGCVSWCELYIEEEAWEKTA